MFYLLFNLIEGVWWIGLGVWVAWCNSGVKRSITTPAYFESSGCRIKSGMTKTLFLFSAIILILLGISDFVEMATGAWWRPWWLLVWKGLCLIVGLVLIVFIFKQRRIQ